MSAALRALEGGAFDDLVLEFFRAPDQSEEEHLVARKIEAAMFEMTGEIVDLADYWESYRDDPSEAFWKAVDNRWRDARGAGGLR